jgi:hypothetical protein
MGTYDQIIRELSDCYKARGIARVIYFHCDHFEPWVTFGSRLTVDERHAEDLRAFADDMAKIDYARKLTLFYRCHTNYVYDRGRELIRAADDDLVGFVPRTNEETEIARSGMKYLADTGDHELQIHIHHEGFTYNTSHKRPEVVEFFKSERARALDGSRLALAITLSKAAIQQETDREIDNWFFVHGHWALNASDTDSCVIENEIDLLMQNGCQGDFTFPAGRGHVNPYLEVPYFCAPIHARRAYDLPDAMPEFAYGNAAAAGSKFFIWASKIKHKRSSIDYYAPWVRQSLERPDEWARDIVNLSFEANGNLFVKTHAHSMFPYYRDVKRKPIYPHLHPGVQTLFSLVFDAAAKAGIAIEFLTAGEVYHRFISAGCDRAQGYALVIPDMGQDVTSKKEESAADLMAGVAAADALEAAVLPAAQEPKASDFVDAAAVATTGKARSAADSRPLLSQPPPELAVIQPLHPSDAAKIVNDVANRVMAARIERMGEAGSGAYNYYRARVARGQLVADYELKVAALLHDLPAFRNCYEIGSGIAVLPMLLALSGYEAIGIEGDRRRRAAAGEVYDALRRRRPELPLRCELIAGRFPDVVADRDLSQSIAVLTNFVATTSEEQLQSMLDAFGRFAAVLIDVDRFTQKRETDEERHLLLSRFEAAGLKNAKPIMDLGESGRYYLIVNDQT